MTTILLTARPTTASLCQWMHATRSSYTLWQLATLKQLQNTEPDIYNKSAFSYLRTLTTWHQKIVASDYVGDPYGCAKFGANPSTGGFWADGWRNFYLFIYLFIPFFHDPPTDFHAWWLKRRGFAQGCAFWGFRWHCSPLWGWNTPKPPIFGAWIGVFKPNGQDIESFMLSKLLHRFQRNFAQR